MVAKMEFRRYAPSSRHPPHAAWLGIDVGTSRCKVAVIDDRGRVLSEGSSAIPTRRQPDGEVSQRPDDWLRAVRSAAASAVAQVSNRIEAISITAPAHVAVLADRRGRPLAPALLAFDSRPAEVAAELRNLYGPGLFATTYVRLTAGWTFAQLAWLRAQEPSWWPAVRSVLPQKDWVRRAMTGITATDPTDAAGTGLYDQRAGHWVSGLIDDLTLERNALPPITHPLAPGGGVGRAWARALGVRVGTPVVVGATDTATELVSVGATASGNGIVKVASTGTVVVVTSQPVPDPRLLTYPHAVDGHWYSVGATNAATVSLQWLRESVFGRADRAPAYAYEEMDDLAGRVAPGAGGVLFLPHLQGDRTPSWDASARGAFLGLSSAHDRRHLARAVLEGVAFSLRACRDTLSEVGLETAVPYLTGGGMSSRVWRSIVTAALGQNGRHSEAQGPAIGAALLAARANGQPELTSSAPVRTIAYRRSWADDYDRAYQRYRMATVAIAPINHAIADNARRDRSSE